MCVAMFMVLHVISGLCMCIRVCTMVSYSSDSAMMHGSVLCSKCVMCIVCTCAPSVCVCARVRTCSVWTLYAYVWVCFVSGSSMSACNALHCNEEYSAWQCSAVQRSSGCSAVQGRLILMWVCVRASVRARTCVHTRAGGKRIPSCCAMQCSAACKAPIVQCRAV